MSMLRFLFCIRDEHETLVATLDMWKFRVVTNIICNDPDPPLADIVLFGEYLSFYLKQGRNKVWEGRNGVKRAENRFPKSNKPPEPRGAALQTCHMAQSESDTCAEVLGRGAG